MPCVYTAKILSGKSNMAGEKDFVRMPADIAGGMKTRAIGKKIERPIIILAIIAAENLAHMATRSENIAAITAISNQGFGEKKMEFKKLPIESLMPSPIPLIA